MGVIAPGVGLRQQLGRRATFRPSIQDFILDFAEDPQHAPALTLGISFR